MSLSLTNCFPHLARDGSGRKTTRGDGRTDFSHLHVISTLFTPPTNLSRNREQEFPPLKHSLGRLNAKRCGIGSLPWLLRNRKCSAGQCRMSWGMTVVVKWCGIVYSSIIKRISPAGEPTLRVCNERELHLHLSLNRLRSLGHHRWLHNQFFPPFLFFFTGLSDFVNSRPVHSLVLSPHLFLHLPCLLPPFTVPCQMVLARPDELETMREQPLLNQQRFVDQCP